MRIDLLLRLFELLRHFHSDANLVSASRAAVLELHGQRAAIDTHAGHHCGRSAADVRATAVGRSSVNSSRTGWRHDHGGRGGNDQ